MESESEVFKRELAALYNKHGYQVKSCSCCGTWIDKVPEGKVFTADTVEEQ